MMKHKVFLAGVLAALLTFGLTGCDNGSTSSVPLPEAKSVKITGITGSSGRTIIVILASDLSDDSSMVAAGFKPNGSDGDTTLGLLLLDSGEFTTTPWTGIGEYYVIFGFDNGDDVDDDPAYIFTNGAALGAGYSGAVKVNFDSALKTLAFNKFEEDV